jgi:hypothetical protein
VSPLIDVVPIVKDHFSNLRSQRTGKYMWDAVAVFYGVPLALGGLGILLEWRVDGVGNILAAFALLAGLLFNLLVLLFDVAVKAKSSSTELKLELAKQIQSTVTYALLISLFTVVVLGVESGMGVERIDRWVSGVVIALLAHFVLTLMMILRRIRAAFLNNFR